MGARMRARASSYLGFGVLSGQTQATFHMGNSGISGQCVIGLIQDVSGVFCAEVVSVEWVALGVEGAELLEEFQLEFLVEAL